MVLPRLILTSRQIVSATQIFSNISKVNNVNSPKYFSLTAYRSADRRYTDKHEWVEVNGNIGTIGISHYAQEALGDVVYAQLPDVGTVLKQKDECGALESVKAASEIYSPVSGTVTEKNTNVEETPSLINSSCYEKGWLFKVELADTKEISELMDEKKYEEFLKSDDHH